MAIYLIRHGQSKGNAGGLLQGSQDYGLSELGRHQAAALGDWLRGKEIQLRTVFTSPLKRALETAQLLTSGLESPAPTARDELREYDAGELEGLTYAESVARFPQFAQRTMSQRGDFSPYGGESRNQIRDRLSRFIGEIQENYADADIAAVGHGGCLYQLICLWCGWPSPEHIFTHLSNCCCLKLKLREVSGHTIAELQWFVTLELIAPELYWRLSAAERRE
jgi:broad specificity phosphatase PhoE